MPKRLRRESMIAKTSTTLTNNVDYSSPQPGKMEECQYQHARVSPVRLRTPEVMCSSALRMREAKHGNW
uniref:Uncharacterized protein n=1 Tax=Panagrellus redivivus TaxID=6233 RepID=A0A7E4US91_PANRE